MSLQRKTFAEMLTFTRAGSATYFDAAGVLQTAAADQPRFDHDPVTKAPKGLLIEGSRTNLLTYSSEFDNAAWVKAGATISANVATAPDGTVTADKLVESAVVETHQVLITGFDYLAATTYTQSIFVKADGRSKVRYSMAPAAFNGIEPYAIFDLNTGTVESFVQCQAQIFSVGNGWYRISMTATTDADGGATLGVSTLRLWTTSATYAGDGISGVLLANAQLEVGAFPSSYIPTTTAAATRAADSAVMTGANFSRWFNPVEGTFLVEASSFGAGVNNGLLFAQKQNSPPRYQMSIGASGIVGAAVVNDASVAVAPGFGPAGAVPFGTVTRVALAYKADDFACTRDGLTPGVDTSGDVPLSVNYLRIGETNNDRLNGHIRSIRYWPNRLSNALLQEITA